MLLTLIENHLYDFTSVAANNQLVLLVDPGVDVRRFKTARLVVRAHAFTIADPGCAITVYAEDVWPFGGARFNDYGSQTYAQLTQGGPSAGTLVAGAVMNLAGPLVEVSVQGSMGNNQAALMAVLSVGLQVWET